MSTQYPMCEAPWAVPALVAAILLASGCSSPGPGSQEVTPSDVAAQDDGGLPTKGGDDDSGLGTKDDGGLGTKDDGGLGTKDDGGLGTNDDGGGGTSDAGGSEDAGSGTEDAGMSGPADAGGEMNDCFACAERRGCAVPVNACVSSTACVDEGKCDLTCLGGPFGLPDPHCVASCSKDLHATAELLAAATCGFRVCPVECLRPLISCGGDAGAGPVEPMEPCALGHAVPH